MEGDGLEFAVMSDIHGNPWALEAVLDDITDVDLIFVLGDIVGIGPLPSEAVDILKKDPRVRKVMGNHDHNTLYGTELGPTDIVPRKPHHQWVRSKLGGEQLEYLKAEMMIGLDDGVSFRFMHRHPLDCGSKVPYYDSPYPDVLDGFYSDVGGDVFFFGHTHFPLDVTGNSGRHYLNPGAVGAQNSGSANYIRVRTGRGAPVIERKGSNYDIEAVREELKQKRPPYWKFISGHFF
ncbi:MAG: metallophosphoesterase family protein [Thermoplasmatota archaeon]